MCDKKCCGTCTHHEPFEKDRFMCTNTDSQYYQDETQYDDDCEYYEED